VLVFVKINDDGEPVPISDRVKVRYQERYKKFKRGLLTPEELEQEMTQKTNS
jgi:co-chaperonin GroES (HSP10)